MIRYQWGADARGRDRLMEFNKSSGGGLAASQKAWFVASDAHEDGGRLEFQQDFDGASMV